MAKIKIGQIVRMKNEKYIRKIMDIRNGEALTIGSDGVIGYIGLSLLEKVSQSEIDMYIGVIEAEVNHDSNVT
jgi:hypothetical protein